MANSESRDRPETEAGKPQIEVTDEMVDAGAKALLRQIAEDDIRDRCPHSIVREVLQSVMFGHVGIIFARSSN